jgi:outer membrane protein OmpA-like peptidoglycan-associated protein
MKKFFIFIITLSSVILFVTRGVAQDGLIERLPPLINTPESSEGLPVISADGKTLYFSRLRKNLDGLDVLDIWKSELDGAGHFSEPTVIEGYLRSRYSIAVTSVAPDNNTLYLIGKLQANVPPDKRIYVTHRAVSGWSLPQSIRIRDLNLRSEITDYSFGPDQRTLIMALDRDSSAGGRDLYISFLDEEKNEWTTPMWLGNNVNSTADEMTPTLASDNRTLYFSSTRPGGFGEVDVYRTQRIGESWTLWTRAENLGSKINRRGRTSYYTIDAKGEYAYFVWRKDVYSQSDIYRIKLEKAESRALLVHGKVTDDNNLPLEAVIRYERLSDGKQLGLAHSDPSTGDYQIALPLGDSYGIRAELGGYVPVNENVVVSKDELKEIIRKDLILIKLRENVSIRLNNIFFATDKAELLPESFAELDRLVLLLQKEQALKIAIEGHTDSTGTVAHNKTLSLARATAVKQYLIQKGIDQKRLEGYGYASAKPLDTNETEEGRAKNRRVEFRILKN